jgi:hypothetical protein
MIGICPICSRGLLVTGISSDVYHCSKRHYYVDLFHNMHRWSVGPYHLTSFGDETMIWHNRKRQRYNFRWLPNLSLDKIILMVPRQLPLNITEERIRTIITFS